MRRVPVPVWILIALLAGFAAGILYRRYYNPTLEEKMGDAAEDVRQGLEKAQKRLSR